MSVGGNRAIRKLHESRVVARLKVVRLRPCSALTDTETTELQRLFDLMADTCDGGNIILGTGLELGPEPDRLRELTERVDAMVNGVKSILG